ncbi:MAG TPA: hypothetical protein VGR59_11960 [Gemmatimonadaceae bacterium]|nr:hypothetical protein [Gemmatimonadaceae bacterium]
MLDDDEWAVLVEAHRSGGDEASRMAVIERARVERGLPAPLPLRADATPAQRKLRHLSVGYEMFTGVAEADPNLVWHHVVSQYGPPCVKCAKPLRHAGDEKCRECGTVQSARSS